MAEVGTSQFNSRANKMAPPATIAKPKSAENWLPPTAVSPHSTKSAPISTCRASFSVPSMAKLYHVNDARL